VVQTVTSSVIYSSGSNVFGNNITNTQVFTGSMSLTGSLTVTTTGTELQVTSTGVRIGNVIGDVHNITGSVGISGSLSGSSATFSGNLNQNAPIFIDNSNHELASFGNNNLQLFFSSIYDGTNIIAKSGAGGRIVMNGGAFSFQLFGSATTGSVVTPTEKFAISNGGTATFSGSVGIGTSSPSTLFHINTARSSGADVNIITLSDNVAGVQTSGFGVRIVATSNNGQAKSAIAFEADGGTNNDTAIAFYTQTSAASLDRRMTINKSGNVGIGTSSPDGRLEVSGSIKMSGTTNAAFFGSIQASWAGSTGYPTLYGANVDRWVMHINPHVSYTQNGVNGYTGTTYGAMIRMASNPAADNYWDIGIGVNGIGTDKFGIGRNTTSLATLTTAGVWSTTGGGTSDARTKQNIEYIKTSGIDAINTLKPAKFEFINNPEKTRRGFIAQDVLKVIPDLVLGDGEKEDGTYGLDYDGVLALAVKAIQELKAEIEILKNK